MRMAVTETGFLVRWWWIRKGRMNNLGTVYCQVRGNSERREWKLNGCEVKSGDVKVRWEGQHRFSES